MILHESASTALQIQIHDKLHVLGVSFLFYDYLITFGNEIEYMWLRPKARSTWWYFGNRYFSLLSNIAVTVLNFTSLTSMSCRRYNIARQILLVLNQALVCLLFSLRISALYGRSFWIVGFMICAGAGLGVAALVQLLGQKSLAENVSNQMLDSFVVHPEVGLLPRGIRLSIAWGALFAYDVILFGLSIFKTCQTRRNNGMVPIVELVFRDGAVYFAIVTLVNGANIITFWTSGPFIKGGLSTFAGCVSSAMMSRLMLNLHAATNLGIYSTFTPDFGASQNAAASCSSQHCRETRDGVELDTLWTADLESTQPCMHVTLIPEFQIPELHMPNAPPRRSAG